MPKRKYAVSLPRIHRFGFSIHDGCAEKNLKLSTLSTWQVHSFLCATFPKPALKTMQNLSHYRYFGEDSAQAIHAHPRKTACTWFSSWSWLPTCDAHFGPKHPMKQCCCSQPRSLSNVPVLRYLVCTWMHRLVLKHFGCEPMNQAYVKWAGRLFSHPAA